MVDAPETTSPEATPPTAGFPAVKILLLLLAAYLLLILPLALTQHGLWPDEALYMGATKNFLSGKGLVLGGEVGIFPFLPLLSLLFSALVGGFSKTPFYLATTLMGVLSVVFTYLLGRKLTGSSIAGLSAAALLASNHVFFFYSSRILLDIYDSAICTAGLLFLLNFSEKPTPKRALLFGATAALGYLIRLPNLIILVLSSIPVFARQFIGKGRIPAAAAAKNTGIFATAAIVPTVLWLLASKTPFFGVYASVAGSAIQEIPRNWGNFFASLEFIQLPYSTVAGILPEASLGPITLRQLAVLAATLGSLALFLRKPIFPSIAIFALFSPLSRIAAYPYDARYFVTILPLLSIALANLLSTATARFAKNKKLQTAIILFATLAIAMPSLSIGTSMFEGKKGGYVEIEYSAEWLRKNTDPGEPVFAGAHRIVSLFSEREVIPIPQDEEEFLAELEAGRARYIEIDNYDWAQPQYALGLVQKYPERFLVEKAFTSQAGGGSFVLKYQRAGEAQ